MKTLEELEKKEIVVLLNKCWMTHDGMWFYHCANEFGMEKTNQLNKKAINALAPIEVSRLKHAVGFEKETVETFEELKRLLNRAADLFIPDFMGGIFDFPEENVFRAEMKPEKCFAYKGMKMLGVIEEYQCGVIYRLECWFNALGLTYSVSPPSGKCSMRSGGECKRDFRFAF